MRVEAGDHAFDGGLLQLGVGHGLDVFATHPRDDFVEQSMVARFARGRP